MADVGTSLRTWLIAQSGVSAIIGASTAARCRPDVLKQGEPIPAVIYYTVSSVPDHLLKGLANLYHDRIRFDCYADTRLGATALAQACIDAGLVDLRGSYSGVFISSIELDSGPISQQEFPTDGNQTHRYIASFDLIVHYSR